MFPILHVSGTYYDDLNTPIHCQDRIEYFRKDYGLSNIGVRYQDVIIIFWILEYRKTINWNSSSRKYNYLWGTFDEV